MSEELRNLANHSTPTDVIHDTRVHKCEFPVVCEVLSSVQAMQITVLVDWLCPVLEHEGV